MVKRFTIQQEKEVLDCCGLGKSPCSWRPLIANTGQMIGALVAEGQSLPVTHLLRRWRSGDELALEELIPLVYEELRLTARRQLRRERPGHSLQSAALVNEAYLRLIDQRPFAAESRAHFLSVAARLMRQVLVDHARSHGAAKRGADQIVYLDISLVLPQARAADVLALDDALSDLSKMDEQQGRVVELRFFGGLSTEEIATVLSISPSTVKRDWNVAKAWLARAMRKGTNDDRGSVGAH